MAQWERNVFSSNLQTVGYDTDAQEMTVSFVKGRTYAYADVPEEVALQLATAASPGTMLREEIVNQYAAKRIR